MAAKLVYTAIASLDLYVADATGDFDWAAPDEELHARVNDIERESGTSLLGRKMYETLAVWETWDTADEPEVVRDYAAIWRATDKVVYSRTLPAVSTARTRLERSFDPEAVRALKASATRDIGIGGPHLAAEAFRVGLVDELHLFLHPIIIGSGNAALPADMRLALALIEERRFASGVVHLHYRVRG
jgi:dihydrofolate reductase